MRKFFIFQVYYRCVDTLVYTSDVYYYTYEECLEAAKACEDKDHYAIVSQV